jgi:hypothetical protein
MKFVSIFLTGVLLLSGCAVQKFDGGEYGKIAAAASTLSPKICSDPAKLKTNLDSFADQLDYLDLYEGGLLNNNDTIKMLIGVDDETVRFQNIVNNSPNVSWKYCNDKVAGIRHTLTLVLRAEGSKAQ